MLQKLYWPFAVSINCSSDLKIFANSQPSSLINETFFSHSKSEQFWKQSPISLFAQNWNVHLLKICTNHSTFLLKTVWLKMTCMTPLYYWSVYDAAWTVKNWLKYIRYRQSCYNQDYWPLTVSSTSFKHSGQNWNVQ